MIRGTGEVQLVGTIHNREMDNRLLRATRKVGVMWIAVSLVVSCRQEPRLQGVLLPGLDSLIHGNAPTECNLRASGAGQLRPCLQRSDSALVYYVHDASGTVVMVAKEWQAPHEPDLGSSSRLRMNLEGTFGRAKTCSHASPNWQIDDERWQSDAFYTALIRLKPAAGLGVPSLTRVVKHLGQIDCDDVFNPPLAR